MPIKVNVKKFENTKNIMCGSSQLIFSLTPLYLNLIKKVQFMFWTDQKTTFHVKTSTFDF